MFNKVFKITATGNQYEKQSGDFYYTIQESGRIIDEDNYLPYLDWIAAGNIPEVVAGERFLSIIDNQPVIAPDRDSILQTEKWTTIRAQRDALLVSCDWTQLSDVPLTTEIKSIWQTYRQALRDITTQSDPDNITWPTKP